MSKNQPVVIILFSIALWGLLFLPCAGKEDVFLGRNSLVSYLTSVARTSDDLVICDPVKGGGHVVSKIIKGSLKLGHRWEGNLAPQLKILAYKSVDDDLGIQEYGYFIYADESRMILTEGGEKIMRLDTLEKFLETEKRRQPVTGK